MEGRRNPLRSGSPTARTMIRVVFEVRRGGASQSPQKRVSDCKSPPMPPHPPPLGSGRNPLRSGSPTASLERERAGEGGLVPVAIPSEAGLRLQALQEAARKVYDQIRSQSPQKRVSDCKHANRIAWTQMDLRQSQSPQKRVSDCKT